MTTPEGRHSGRSGADVASQGGRPERPPDGEWWTAYGGIHDPASGVIAFRKAPW